MPSYIVVQPDGKFAIFSAVKDDFTSFGMNGEEALAWGVRKWGERMATEKYAAALADQPINSRSQPATDGLGRWRACLTDIAAGYGLNYLRTALSEIGFAGADIPQTAMDVATATGLNSTNSENVHQLKPRKSLTSSGGQSDLSIYLQKIRSGQSGRTESER